MICKDAFLSATDLLCSNLHADSAAVPKLTIDSSFFANTETAFLSPNSHKSCMLREQAMCASMDEELLDGESKSASTTEDYNQNPPPIPPRVKAVSSLGLKSTESGMSRDYIEVSKQSTPLMHSVRQPSPLPKKKLKVEISGNISTSSLTNTSGSVFPGAPKSTHTSTLSGSSVSTPSLEHQPYYCQDAHATLMHSVRQPPPLGPCFYFEPFVIIQSLLSTSSSR